MTDRHEKFLDGAVLCAYLALATMPGIAMLSGIRGQVLHGVLPPTPRPELEFARVLTEEYQLEFGAWVESNLGIKGTSIATDNTILYHAFGETKPGAPVRIGEDGVLFLDQDLDYFNRYEFIPKPAFIRATAARIAKAQRLLAKRGKALVPIIVPGKATVWRDKVPAVWKLPLGEPRPTDTLVYEQLVGALDHYGARYVDMRETITTSSTARALLFGADARHWSEYAACLAMDDVASLYAELTGKPRPEHASELEMVSAVPGSDDFDLWRMLNANFVARAAPSTPAARHAPPSTLAPRPTILFVGTSFCWSLLREADASGLYGTLHLNYYNSTFETWPVRGHKPVEPDTEAWREIVLGKDLYVLDLFEVFLCADGYLDLFLRDFVPELERTR